MDVSTFVMILGALFLLAVLLIGGGIAMMRNQRKADAARIAEEKQAVLREPAQGPGMPGSAAEQAGPVEILRVLRDPVGGRLTVRLRGEQADHVAAFNPGQKGQLRRVIDELNGWLETPVETGAAPADVEEAPREPETPVPFASTLPEEPELADRLPFRKKPAPPKPEDPPQPPRSIAAQIDEILQEKLAQSSFAGQTVRLSEEPGGGLKIIVGDHHYQGIDEVAEEEVKALIKSAVREWNEKNRLKPNQPEA